ncbi:unnamed protein product [Protopolystoma xenopodis]|uniref:Uncharacterized protein n=1 Tax=Protopolystoma xenopodis TaxID=117903 RepID=A0A448XBE6_9PLAT|nr:unnamed protein product [Protopolystoma xenopodis]
MSTYGNRVSWVGRASQLRYMSAEKEETGRIGPILESFPVYRRPSFRSAPGFSCGFGAGRQPRYWRTCRSGGLGKTGGIGSMGKRRSKVCSCMIGQRARHEGRIVANLCGRPTPLQPRDRPQVSNTRRVTLSHLPMTAEVAAVDEE